MTYSVRACRRADKIRTNYFAINSSHAAASGLEIPSPFHSPALGMLCSLKTFFGFAGFYFSFGKCENSAKIVAEFFQIISIANNIITIG
jgi:hypothetical protein